MELQPLEEAHRSKKQIGTLEDQLTPSLIPKTNCLHIFFVEPASPNSLPTCGFLNKPQQPGQFADRNNGVVVLITKIPLPLLTYL